MKKRISLFLAAVLLIACAGCGAQKPEPATSTQAASETQETAQSTSAADAQTTAPQTTSAQPTTAMDEALSAAVENDWADYPADTLYEPPKAFLNDAEGYAIAYCTDIDVQNYVKMRYGPSKTHFSALDLKIPNGESVYIQSESVNGWTLCEYHKYNGNGESKEYRGWVRSDFIFEEPDYQLDRDKYEDAMMELYLRIGALGTGDYDYSGTQVYSGPGKNTAVVLKMKDLYRIVEKEWTPIENGWVKVTVIDYNVGDDFNPYEDEYPTVGTGYVPVDELHPSIPDGVGDKPVLYMYPEKTTDVDVCVNLAKDVFFSCTYPAYRGGWHVTAQPDGTLTDRATGREYAYLYWELVGKADYTFDEGFVVKGSDTAEFLENVLSEIGLNARERNEFIVYWLPRMQNNAYNLISFQTEAYTSLVDLQITPSPDSLLRVFMAYRALNAPVQVPTQRFTTFVRTGFTAVEWGGAEVGAPR